MTKNAPGGNRTPDTRFRKPLLSPLSYRGRVRSILYRAFWKEASRDTEHNLVVTAPKPLSQNPADEGSDCPVHPSHEAIRDALPKAIQDFGPPVAQGVDKPGQVAVADLRSLPSLWITVICVGSSPASRLREI